MAACIPETNDARLVGDREISATRIYDAPREFVWKLWTDPKHIVQWWGPNGFTTTIHEMEVKPQGVWRFIMHGPDGRDYKNRIVYLEVKKPERLVYKHVPERDSEPVNFEVTVNFSDKGGKTQIDMRMLFPSAAHRDFVVKQHKAVEGLTQTLGRLATHVKRSSEAPDGESRKLIVSNVMSLDGFFERPGKKFDWFVPDEEFLDYAKDLLLSVDTLLFGRTTYEHMAAYWPSAPADEIAVKMNNLPKLVASRTLKNVEWNNSKLIQGDIAEEISKLKKMPGRDIVIFGSATLASELLQRGLVDEYRVILSPILLGAGSPMFPDMNHEVFLKLKRTRPLKSGVVVLYYEKNGG